MPRYSEEALIQLLLQFTDEFGHCPSPAELDATNGYPSARIYQKRFDSWNNALYKAGLKKELVQSYWSDLDSLEKWYYLGFIIGDGSITTNTNKEYTRLQIALNEKDKEWLDTALINFNTSNKLCYRANTRSYGLSITSKQWVKDLAKYYVVPRKSYCAKLPLEFIETEQQAAALLLGLFDADGHVGIYNTEKQQHQKFSIVGTSDICLDMRKLLSSYIYINSGSIYHNSDVTHTIKWASKSDLIKIREFLYQNTELSPIWLKRKHNKFNEI